MTQPTGGWNITSGGGPAQDPSQGQGPYAVPPAPWQTGMQNGDQGGAGGPGGNNGTNGNWVSSFSGPGAAPQNTAANPYAPADTAYDYGGYTGGAQQYGAYYGNLASNALGQAAAGVAPVNYGQYGVDQAQGQVNSAIAGQQGIIAGQEGLLGQQANLANSQYQVANEQNALGQQGQGVFANQGALAGQQLGVAGQQGALAGQQLGVAGQEGALAAQGQQVFGEQQGLAGQQQGLANMLALQAQGGGPNPAAIQFQQGLNASLAAQQSIAASARGGGMGLESAERNAAGQAGQMQQSAVNQLGLQSAQQQLSAEGQLAAQQGAMGNTYGNAGSALAGIGNAYGNEQAGLGAAGASYGNEQAGLGAAGNTYGAQGQTLAGIGGAYGNAGAALGQVGSTYGQMGNVYGQAGAQYGQIAGEAANQAAQGIQAAQFGTSANLTNQGQQFGQAGAMTQAQQNVATEQLQASGNLRGQSNAIGQSKSAQNTQIVGSGIQAAASAAAYLASDVTNKTDISGGGPSANSMIQRGAQGAAPAQQQQQPAPAPTSGQGSWTGLRANTAPARAQPAPAGDFSVQPQQPNSAQLLSMSRAMGGSLGGGPAPGQPGGWGPAPTQQGGAGSFGPYGGWAPPAPSTPVASGWSQGAGTAPGSTPWLNLPASPAVASPPSATQAFAAPQQTPNQAYAGQAFAPTGAGQTYQGTNDGYYGPSPGAGGGVTENSQDGYQPGDTFGTSPSPAPASTPLASLAPRFQPAGITSDEGVKEEASAQPSSSSNGAASAVGKLGASLAAYHPAPLPGDAQLRQRSIAYAPITSDKDAKEEARAVGFHRGWAAAHATESLGEGGRVEEHLTRERPAPAYPGPRGWGATHETEGLHLGGVDQAHRTTDDGMEAERQAETALAVAHRAEDAERWGKQGQQFLTTQRTLAPNPAMAAQIEAGAPLRYNAPPGATIPGAPLPVPAGTRWAPQAEEMLTSSAIGANPAMHARYDASPNPLASLVSDERDKDDKQATADRLIDGFLDRTAESRAAYRYKDPSFEPTDRPTGGLYLGAMAQSLEKSPGVGHQIVKEGPRGKVLEQGPLLSAILAGQGRQTQRIKELERRAGGGRR